MASRLSVFLAELKRRKVTRVAVVYSVVGFVVWQAAEIAFPALDLPDQALTFVVVVTGLGFPIALVLSWAYELKPEDPRPSNFSGGVRPAPTPSYAAAEAMTRPGTDERGSAIMPRQAEQSGPKGEDRAIGSAVRRSSYRVLVVDDEPDARLAHSELVHSFGYESETASDGIEALAKLSLDIDLVMLDADMPNMDGFEVARRIRSDPSHVQLPIVMVTGLDRPETRAKALEVGVNDFVLKPVDAQEFKMRASWLLELKTLYDSLEHHQGELEREVERKTTALRTALEQMTEARRVIHEIHLDTIRRLTIAAEYADQAAAGHIHRIGLYSEVVARGLGLPPTEVDTIRHAAPMHDVGKIGIPPQVLMKPGKLDEAEWDLVKSHTRVGAEILSGSPSPVIQMGETISLTHHERWDGAGYPVGLAGEAIPLEGRICGLVDHFDALTMDRPHRKALDVTEVVRMMKAESGAHFDPEVLDVFLTSMDEISDIRSAVGADFQQRQAT